MLLVAFMPAFYRGVLLAQAAAFVVYLGIRQAARRISRKMMR